MNEGGWGVKGWEVERVGEGAKGPKEIGEGYGRGRKELGGGEG